MTKFIAAIFEDRAKAEEGKSILLSLDRDRTISIGGLSIIAREPTGALTVLEPAAQDHSGDAVRGLVSQLDDLIGRRPLAPVGLLTDLGSWGDLVDFGVTPNFVEKIAAELSAGKVALLGEIEEDWITPLDTRLETIGCVLIRTWRSDFEAEQRIKNDGAKGQAGAPKAERC